MKTIGTFRRNKSHSKLPKDQVGLLSKPSRPPSPAVWGVEENLVLFPTTATPAVSSVHDSSGSTAVVSPTSRASSIAKSSSSQVPMDSRFMPQHEPRKGKAPEDLFVPAYAEAASSTTPLPVTTSSPPRSATPTRTSSAVKTAKSPKAFRNGGSFDNGDDNSASASWDAIIEADVTTAETRRSWRGKPKSSPVRRDHSSERSMSSAEEKKSASPAVIRRNQPPVGMSGSSQPGGCPVPVIRVSHSKEDDGKSMVSMSHSTASSTGRQGTRVARLKQLFSSRAVVSRGGSSVSNKQVSPKPDHAVQASTAAPTRTLSTNPVNHVASKDAKVPPSPSSSGISGSSAGFVWPGTQDKRGKTVNIESSYDDSSVGPIAFQRKDYESELEAAADLEMRKWMDEPSFDECSIDTRDQLTPLEQRIEHGPANGVFEEDNSDEEGENAADFHLAAVLADVNVSSPMRTVTSTPKKSPDPPASISGLSNHSRSTRFSYVHAPKSVAASSVATSASGALSIHNLFASDRPREGLGPNTMPEFKEDPWDVEDSSHPPSSPGTSVSKDSSVYLQAPKVAPRMDLRARDNASLRYGVSPNMRSVESVIRRKSEDPQPTEITEEALAMNDRLSPSPRTFNAHMVRGYEGYIHKTRDVPNLIDAADSDSIETSSRVSTAVYSAINEKIGRALPPDRDLPVLPMSNRSPVNGNHVGGSPVDFESDSDVFDGLSHAGFDPYSTKDPIGPTKSPYDGSSKSGRGTEPHRKSTTKASGERNDDKLNVVLLGGGLTSIQTTQDHFDNRATPSDFDDNLTNSDVDQFGFARTPGFNEMLAAGRSMKDSAKFMLPHDHPTDDSEGPSPRKRDPGGFRPEPRGMFDNTFGASFQSSDSEDSQYYDPFGGNGIQVSFVGDLSKYKVHPNQIKKLVRHYRKMCCFADPDCTVEELNFQEDSKKAFALTEMRSRIMEKDIERGLERQGGTTIVDDLVLTPYNQSASRVRDAVIVSKAWRDGASPRDVITSSNLTRRAHSYHLKRTVRLGRGSSPNKSMSFSSDSNSVMSEYSYNGARVYTFEEVQWVDDADFTRMRCPSLGPRCMHGFEMFTIGDCQSILLKLTNERCIQLREELNEATAIQIDAEELMKEDGDLEDGVMTDAEMIYLAAMEDVKTISKQLVVAERSFHLVRDRIEKLVAKYEALLVKIENESVAGSASIVTYESSYYSDEEDSQYFSEDEKDREREMFQRRVQRAEIRAELAAREAMMAKQEAQKIKQEKQAEIDALEQRLADLQSETSFAISQREHSAVLAKAISSHAGPNRDTQGSRNDRAASPKIDQAKILGVKQRFRDRMANRKHGVPATDSFASEGSSAVLSYTPSFDNAARRIEDRPPIPKNHRHRLVGEEMFQHLDFYERSLKSVKEVARGKYK